MIVVPQGPKAVIGSGVDWVTVTGRLDPLSPELQIGDLWFESKMSEEDWAGNGYSGKICPETNTRYGSRITKDGEAEEILIASGEASQDVCSVLAREKHSLNCTRLDLQSTVHLDLRDADVACRAYDGLVAIEEKGGAMPTGRKPYSLIRSGTGDTLYVGSRRTRGKFFRLYDKGGERGGETGLVWRQEVQYNRKFANSALKIYCTMRYDGESLSDLVTDEFRDCCGFSVAPLLGGKIRSSEGVCSEIVSRETNYEAKLKWLKTCVRPAVSDLLNMGLIDETVEALGLGREVK